MPVRVLTVDDSPLFLEILSGILDSDPGLSLVGSARDGKEAIEKLLALSPDVVTLDVEMPVMDGLSTLERIMELRPTPVIMVSSHTRRSSAATVRALQLGASDFVTKPEHPLRDSYEPLRNAIVETIRAVRGPPVRPASRDRRAPPRPRFAGGGRASSSSALRRGASRR